MSSEDKNVNNYIHTCLKSIFTQIENAPILSCNEQDEIINITDLVKNHYDIMQFYCESYTVNDQTQVLPKLITKQMNAEQLWQQIDLDNAVTLPYLTNVLEKYQAIKPQSKTPILDNNISEMEETAEDSEINYDDDDEDDDEDLSDAGDSTSSVQDNEQTVMVKESEVDDMFFKKSEMDYMLLTEDKNERDGKIMGEVIDHFLPSYDDDEDENIPLHASDFFRDSNEPITIRACKPKSEKRIRFELPDSDDETQLEITQHEERIEKSNFEKRQGRIQKQVEELEKDILSEKPWQMMGEVASNKRPMNSLIEESLDFELTTRPAPVMTEEVMEKLEQIIIKRIREKAWDDVEKKVKPVDTPVDFRKKLVLNQEKSKLSLAQIYEQEYVKQRESLKGEKTEVEEPKAYKQISKLSEGLFRKLDALSNYHYTPKLISPEIEILTNKPSLMLEEAIPMAESDATLLAPQEVQEKVKGLPIGDKERTRTDKKRQLRKKKIFQKLHPRKTKEDGKLLKKPKFEILNIKHKNKILVK